MGGKFSGEADEEGKAEDGRADLFHVDHRLRHWCKTFEGSERREECADCLFIWCVYGCGKGVTACVWLGFSNPFSRSRSEECIAA